MYLDRYYVKYNSLPNLEEAGTRHFKNLVFDVVKRDVSNAILVLIDKERDGDQVNRDLIRSCVQLFEAMGMGSLECYTMDFEALLLNKTREYYARKAETWIQQDSTPTYLLKAEQAIEDERTRVQNYLNPDTESKILRVLEEEVLQNWEQELLDKEGSGCRVLLSNDMFSDLARMYRLFSRIPDGLSPIADHVRCHIASLGNDKIDQRMQRLSASEEKESNEDPQFVKDLLAIHEKFIKIVNEHFSGNALFQKALKDAFVEVVNKDVGKFKTADLLSSFADRILKTGSSEKLSDSEIEDFLEKTVQMFSYLSDKDVFAEIYRNQLAKRLLHQRSASDDMERLMISKLKLRCGAQFTAKMEGMLNDLAIGADHAKAFEDYCKEREAETGLGKLEFGVQVLTTGYWPTYKTFDLRLPPIMSRCLHVFKEFYDSKNSHRRLQWTHSLGNATVKGTFGKRSYDLQVVTLQACALMAFNADTAPKSFTELNEILGMNEEVLKRVLHSLSCGKFRVIKRLADGGTGEKDAKASIKTSDVFAFNDQFTCQMRKIRIPMASLEDASQTTKRVEEDRSVAIEAATVRIMKARKTLSHQQLVSEILTQLAFFRPDPKVIKRRIENLIEREYLERDPDNQNTYRYLA